MLADGFVLIPMLEFVSHIGNRNEHETYKKDLATIYNYATLLEQPLKPEMFFPCDENGLMIEEPKLITKQSSFDEWIEDYDNDECEIYRFALSKVLFKNTSISFDDGVYWLILNDNYIAFYNFNDKFEDKILEDFAFRKDLVLKEDVVNRIFS